MILEFFSSGPADTNSILLACSKTLKGAIIDAPFDSVYHQMLRAQDLSLHIEMCLLTHSHWDHIAEAAILKNEFGIPLYIHEEDAQNLIHPGSDGLPHLFPLKGVVPDHFLNDGEILSLGELKIEVIHTPGHSPGCVCFYIEKEQVLISGDTLFQASIGNLSFPTARPRLMWESLKKLSLLPKKTRVIPGHGNETTIGAESWLANAKEKFGGYYE
ncbi:MAG TPA: MBL fold metallo-hydrolase [Rhabdochlamydiaceae bacterium]|nr:MBL fold metallo-hydrolase [Rhabdochlamydiaceae bacterium]